MSEFLSKNDARRIQEFVSHERGWGNYPGSDYVNGQLKALKKLVGQDSSETGDQGEKKQFNP